MHVLSSPPDHTPDTPACVTIGNFDGIHSGHRALIQRTITKARTTGSRSVVITFWPHPLHVVAPHKAPPLLVTREERLDLLAAQGIDTVLELPFTPALAACSPEDFVRQVLTPLHCTELVIGYDFSLGKGRSGNLAVLTELGRRYGFGVEQIAPVLVNGAVASASRIRDSLRAGQVQEARDLLGRWHSFTAPLSHGFGRGSGMGVPTLNMYPQTTMLPGNGVYVTWVFANNRLWPAVTNVGTNPTFNNDHLSVESHLLDATIVPDASPVTVYFVQRLRDERRFPTTDALVQQMHKDIAQARAVLAACPADGTNAPRLHAATACA